MLFITHDIEEALLLADTVYVMTARPGRIKRRLAVELPRPRSIEETASATFNELKRELLALIREESLKAAGATSSWNTPRTTIFPPLRAAATAVRRLDGVSAASSTASWTWMTT
ncbi:MAG: hypothetical protein HYV92_00960 [Candidatus Rokubacteria bacterium]|nr:hypothetical protein [Candidatus Rokubacteria bacterium]